MECTNNAIENDSNLNITDLNTVMDLADIITGRKSVVNLLGTKNIAVIKIILQKQSK